MSLAILVLYIFSLLDYRIDKVENQERPRRETESAVNTNKKTNSKTMMYDPDQTITATNITQIINDEIAKDLVGHLSDSTRVLAEGRLMSWVNGKSTLVKISFQSVEEKIEVLRKESDLMVISVYKSIFLRLSKSHKER